VSERVHSSSGIVTLDDLHSAGLTERDVRKRCPHAVEYVAIDGRPCWHRANLLALLAEEDQ
jgi:hypothetical protein